MRKNKTAWPANPYKQARLAAGLTQEEAVEHLPFSLRSMQAYETGRASPKYENVVAMAELYGCCVSAFALRHPEGRES